MNVNFEEQNSVSLLQPYISQQYHCFDKTEISVVELKTVGSFKYYMSVKHKNVF